MQENLYRSRNKRVIGGVAAGLADYFNIDPILVRVIFIATTIIKGFGLLVYIVLWIIVPEDPKEQPHFKAAAKPPEPDKTGTAEEEATEMGIKPEPEKSAPKKENNKNRLIAGIILISIGVLFLFDNLFVLLDLITMTSIVLIIIGISLIWNYKNRNKIELEHQ